MSAGGKQIRGGEGRRSRNSSGAVEGGEVGAAAVRRRTAWLNWLGYGRFSPRLQLLAVEGVAVEVTVDDDVGVSAPA